MGCEICSLLQLFRQRETASGGKGRSYLRDQLYSGTRQRDPLPERADGVRILLFVLFGGQCFHHSRGLQVHERQDGGGHGRDDSGRSPEAVEQKKERGFQDHRI